jgi:hypothetical protein
MDHMAATARTAATAAAMPAEPRGDAPFSAGVVVVVDDGVVLDPAPTQPNARNDQSAARGFIRIQ